MLFVISFVLGVIASYVVNINKNKKIYLKSYLDRHNSEFIIEVASSFLDSSDLHFEYALSAQSFDSMKNDFESIADSRVKFQIKKSILKAVLERRMLFEYIKKQNLLKEKIEDISTFCNSEISHSSQIPKIFYLDSQKQKFVKRECELGVIREFFKRFNQGIELGAEEIKNYYALKKKSFYKNKQYVIRQILLPSESEAKKVKFLLNKKNFSFFAKQYSISPEGVFGGKLGPYEKNEFPHVFNQPASMRKGDVSSIIKSAHGFHIFKLEEIIPARYQSIDEVKSEIRMKIIKAKKELFLSELFKTVIETIPVQIK